MADTITLTFKGGLADEGMLDLYDAARSYQGLARVTAILGHYYTTGNIIWHAPRSAVPVYIYAPEQGSFKQTVVAGVIAGIVSAPFTLFMTRAIDDWLPNPDPQMERMIELLEEQNRLKRIELGLPPEPKEERHQAELEALFEARETELQVVRSICSNSFEDIFRPVGRSAEFVSMTAGPQDIPVAAVNPPAVAALVHERREDVTRELAGVVNSFSRSSKRGVIFLHGIGRGVPFVYPMTGQIPRPDPFSWSQYTGNPIEVVGEFVYWFDGRIKRLVVHEARWPDDER